jgi:hypothetical protein
MFTFCDTTAPTRHPPGEAHSLRAPAPLMTTFAAGPLPVSRASEVASRRLATPSSRPRHPLSPPLSLRATPQLQPAQPLRACVAKNASGDTRRHATAPLQRLHLAGGRPIAAGQAGALAYMAGPIAKDAVTSSPVAPPVVANAVNDDAPNSNPPNKFGLVSPKTQQATPGDTRHESCRSSP